MKRTWLLVLALLAGLAIWIYADNHRIVTTEYTVSSPDLPDSFRGLRVAELSDLHGAVFGAGQSRLLAAVEAARPDLIALCGDLFDEKTDPLTLDPLLTALCRLAPVYYVTGNHEWAAGNPGAALSHMESLGVTVLGNEYRVLQRDGQAIAVAGVHDPNGPYDMKTKGQLVSEIRAELGDDAYILMLAHRNNQLSQWAELSVQTVLSGHAHGGIVRLPFLGGLIGPGRILFPDYTAGVFRAGKTSLVVGRGLGNSGPMFRVGNPPELPVIVLENGES